MNPVTDGRVLAERLAVPTAAAMRRLGERLAGQLRAGDLLILSGPLGAGKTTLTQGIGAGLGVRGPVTSPTFVIARTHPSLASGPALVHADAYRLASPAEVDDLDLDTTLTDSVTVVEWGGGLADGLSGDRLELAISVGPADGEGDELPREITVTGYGNRWIPDGHSVFPLCQPDAEAI